ncbi:tRNA (guanosine(37)-N1)-methyltransferase TrmD [Candidatus Gottesmanbacteria bacterium]|nr:tRNA (guanosine(37)-N1)-methyltransferase TrmD [Candidatus Gottesmanbacteria bacterium]
MNITILTLFPAVFQPIFDSSILGRARQKKLINVQIIDIRNFAADSHKSVDDKPYGGGAGMLMKVDVLHKAILAVSLKNKVKSSKEIVVLLDPKGKQFSQPLAQKFSRLDHLILVCGHYEGFDDRIKNFVDESVSIGRYILTGGEIPAMVVCDSVGRLVNGVLNKDSLLNESFSNNRSLEAPQYTRPPIYKKYKVPSVLMSGNHLKINIWKKNHTFKSAKKS